MSSVNTLSSLGSSLGSSATGTSGGSGLGQGINVQQFVQFAVANQQANITALQTQQTSLGSQSSELATLTSNLSSLDDAAFALRDPLGALSAVTANSSDASLVSATASSVATPGAHSVSVTSLATTSSYYTDAVASSSTALATGDTISISVGGNSAASVTIDSTNNTLDTLAAAINSQTSAVHASVINDASGARLALVSATSGLPGNISVTGGLHLTDANSTAINFNLAVAGLNASLKVDGVPISSTTNTVTGVINGVTLNLSGPTGNSAVSVTVAPDTAQATTAVNNLVSAYNTVVAQINSQFNVASDGSGGGPLEADNSLREAQSLLLGAISYSVSGNNGIVNLSSIGVNLNNDGTLSVDNGALSSALSSNFSSVQNLLQNSATGFTQNLASVISTLNGPTSGILTLDSQGITSTSQSLNKQILDLQAALAVQEQNLTLVYSKVNATLQELPLLMSQMTQQLSGIS